MENVLKKIIDKKKEDIQIYKKKISNKKIFEKIKNNNNYINFKEKLKIKNKQKTISIIAEIKKASPSAGILKEKFNYMDMAKSNVKEGVQFLSILTEEKFFLGKLEYIENIKKEFKVPVLCKDFFIDTFQVPLAKSFGADCILIILSAVDSKLAKDLYDAANELNISTLVEVHSRKEAELALSFENSLIGINNRNLDTLDVSLNTTVDLVKILKSHKNPLISESGINNEEDVKFIVQNAGIYNFLIGESLIKSNDLSLKLKKLMQINP